MKIHLLFSACALALGLALGGCGGDSVTEPELEGRSPSSADESTQDGPSPSTGQPPARSAPPPPSESEPAPTANRVVVGDSTGPDGAASGRPGPYTLSETVHASAPLSGIQSGANLTVYWTYEDGNTHKEETVQAPQGQDYVAFEFSRADGMQPGTYNVQIDVDWEPIGIAEFRVE